MSTISSILPKPVDGFSTQISTATVSSSDLTIGLDSVSGLPNEGVGQLLKKDADGNLVAGSVEFVHWTNVSGNTITFSDTGDRGITGSDSGAQAYVADDYFEVWVSSYYTPSGIREQINDTNGNEVLKFGATASAVNEITVTNAATGNAPEISATGGDTNIDLKLRGKGTGTVEIYNPTSTAYEAAVGETGWIPAGETWTYASADDPTFTFTIAGVDLTTKYTAGMKIKLTQTTAKYFIITKVAFSTDTTVTVYGGTDYDLANAAITSPYYSTMKAPAGFPLSPLKWQVIFSDTTDQAQGTPTQNQWYNINTATISIPIGAWWVTKKVTVDASDSTVTSVNVQTTLSTANNSESDVAWSSFSQNAGASGNISLIDEHHTRKAVVLTAKASYYLNTRTINSGITEISNRGDLGSTVISADCAYL